jgi:transposase-like protein
MSSKTRNRYNEDFKAQTLELVDTGKPISEVAEELGVSSDLVYRWRRERERTTCLRCSGRTPACAWRTTF